MTEPVHPLIRVPADPQKRYAFPFDRIAGDAALPESARIRVGENGRIHGVDGMLDQIAGALVKHVRPVLASDVIPVLQHDHAMQTRVGAAIGASVAEQLKPWFILGAGALAVVAVVQVVRWHRTRRS
jgi:hypothetical protein